MYQPTYYKYFHLYAVQNWIDFSHLSDKGLNITTISDVNAVALSLQPTRTDDAVIRKIISVLILFQNYYVQK